MKRFEITGIEASMEVACLKKTSRKKTKAAIPSMKKIDKLVLKLLNEQKSQ